MTALNCFDNRLDMELVTIERLNNISSRWTPDCDEYKKEVEENSRCKCTDLYAKIKLVCEERLFLLKLKEKYSGIMFLLKFKENTHVHCIDCNKYICYVLDRTCD